MIVASSALEGGCEELSYNSGKVGILHLAALLAFTEFLSVWTALLLHVKFSRNNFHLRI